MTYSNLPFLTNLKAVYCAVVVLLLVGCEQNKISLISEDDLVKRMAENKVPEPEELRILNAVGDEISSDSLKALISGGDYFFDFYVDKNDEIVQIKVREKTKKDDELIARIQERIDELEEARVLKAVDINCTDKAEILQNVFDRDQAMRTGAGKIDPEIDHENLEIIVSFLNQCGMPTLQEVNDVQMAGIWAVLQHAPDKYQRKYIPLLEESARKGGVKWSVIALMKDRALMHEGKPQLYGSQLKNGELYTLDEPEYVNQRRSEMGMEPIEDYLQRFDIEFNIEQKQKDTTD